MTTRIAQNAEIVQRLDLMNERLNSQSVKIDELKSQIDQMHGGLSVLKALGAILGVGGIGTLLAWFQSQAK